MNHEYIHMHPPALGDLDADLLDPTWTAVDYALSAILVFAVCAGAGWLARMVGIA